MPPTAESPVSPPPDPSPSEPHVSPLPVARERCAACGATLAADQRYCVECGQRCGPARLPFTDASSQRAKQAPSSESRSKRPRPSVNATLIAGIGTLLLALGVGVLIGRLGAGSSATKSPAVQVLTVAGAGGTGTAAGTAGGEGVQTPSTAAKTTTPSATAAKSAKPAPKAAVAPAKVVKVGSKGSGPGYRHGHFTGNFFGE